MALSSIELTARCHQRGLLSKEAMEDVLRVRNKLIKEAMAEKAANVFGDMGRATGRAAKSFVTGESSKPLGWSGAGKNLMQMLALGGALAAGGAGVTGLIRHSRDKRVRKDIEHSYKQMFNETPALNTLDKEKVGRHFDVLARYAPSLAGDPTVAGAWVHGTVRMGHIDADLVNKLSTTQAIIDRHHEGRALFQPGHFMANVNLARQAMGAAGRSGGGDQGG
jgi:hypothetical protein